MARIYLSAPDVGEHEEQLALAAIRSGWVAPLGEHVDAFEREVADRVGTGHGVALSSGTAALHLALVSWGVGPGDVVPTSSMTFVATANAIRYTGATPLFVDSEPGTGNLDVNLLDEALRDLAARGRPARHVLPVDLLGTCADYAALSDLAATHEVRILSDAAESFGSHDGPTAAGAFGDAAVLSFNGNKVMTTSGGGMLLTSDERLAQHVRHLATQAREPAEHYEHRETGYNYRLSNVLAAIGRAQLARLDEMIARRRAVRDLYRSHLGHLPGVRILGDEASAASNCWLTAIVVDPDEAGWSAQDLGRAFAAVDVETRPLWKPMHLQPLFADAESRVNGVSERMFRQGLTLPSGSVLSADDLGRIEDVLTDFLPS